MYLYINVIIQSLSLDNLDLKQKITYTKICNLDIEIFFCVIDKRLNKKAIKSKQ